MDTSNLLLVEDEKKIADTLRIGLTEQGYTVAVAYDGTTGLKQFQNGQFDMVVLDINLPGINGYELCQRIRSVNTHVPVIMLTALSSLKDKIEGYDAGADDFIIKPFEFRELLMKIRVLLKRTLPTAPQATSSLRAGDLELLLDRKEVRRNGQSIHLTAKEFQLLEYLMRHKNRVVSRADIALNVWEIDFDTNTNVIDVYINYLRNKVDKPFANKLIHTQVGMGYILKETS
jgi:two-component system copper resistance phosphate regulon response regulator CusR